MSQGNILQGQASGKLGDTVLMVRNGKQLARVYTTSGARSGDTASESARIQRVKFGAASNQWGLYKYVSTRMYRKGRTSAQSDYNYFVKRNQAYFPYLTKAENSLGVHCLQPGVYSEGNLGRIDLLLQYNPAASENSSKWRIVDSNVTFNSVSWSASTMAMLKEAMKIAYPNASKITFLYSVASTLTLEEEGAEYFSQAISHWPVMFELYKETVKGEDNKTVKEFFASQVKDPTLAALFEAQNGAMLQGRALSNIINATAEQITWLENLGALVFATDENASDCYTTAISPNAVDPLDSVYRVWAEYRTAEQLRLAAESYGYQAGVMRDQVAALGNDLTKAVTAYAARLASVDADAAAAYMKHAEARLAELGAEAED